MGNERESALKIEGVFFSIKKRALLQGIDLDLPPGTALAVVGHNGAGKTTLFQLILGLKFPDRGRITIFGESSLSERARQKIGYVPERPYLNPDHTLGRALRYHSGLAGLPASGCRAEIERVATAVGLAGHLDQKLGTFSKGMLQKSMIALALLGDPPLLILDEPMSGLDPETRGILRSWLLDWKTKGRTILFSSHMPEDVESLADRVLTLKDGRMQGPPVPRAGVSP
jgi:ABC-2 type transport system ATP-binding protein